MAIDLSLQKSVLLSGLRSATASAHDQIERQPNMARLMASDLQLHEYMQVLEGFCLFFQTMEPQIIAQLNAYRENNPNRKFSYNYKPRLPLLYADLNVVKSRIAAKLGTLDQDKEKSLKPHETAIDDINADQIDWPECTNQWELLAILYVLEGSSQGGRILAPRISRTLALKELDGLNEKGCSYFSLWNNTENSWLQWQDWCKQLELKTSSAEINAYANVIFNTAERTFNAISKCMTTAANVESNESL